MRELDKEVAEKIFGWTDFAGEEYSLLGVPPQAKNQNRRWSVPYFSIDLKEAWSVVREMKSDKYGLGGRNLHLIEYAYNRSYASFADHGFSGSDDSLNGEGNGEYATPEAICKAALLLVESLKAAQV